MAKQNFQVALAHILHSEGGYVDHKLDPGGMTNLGVTKRVWEEWVGHSVTEKVMRDLKPEDVAPLYKRKYWDKVQGDFLPDGVDLAVFDAAVNSGPGRAAKWLQEMVGAKADGVIGPQTLTTVEQIDPKKLVADYNAHRLAFLKGLPTFPTFGKGWSNRVAAVTTEALAMTA
jgi:lysozyme family protein